ncbi:MAG: protein translocase subunit SecF [Bryobacteraceae bacterium]
MEIFRNTNFDFLGNKWPFIAASLVLSVAGISSMVMKGGPRYGIDFRGGTNMFVKFPSLSDKDLDALAGARDQARNAGDQARADEIRKELLACNVVVAESNGHTRWAKDPLRAPLVETIRAALSRRITGEITVQNVLGGGNDVLIGTELKSDQELAASRQAMTETLEATFGQPASGKLDFNNAGQGALADRLRDPLIGAGASLSETQLQDLLGRLKDYRDKNRSGLVSSFDELAGIPGVTPAVIRTLKEECYLAPFNVKSVDIVGPKAGAELRAQAIRATLLALAGMLVYIAFRFEWIYGVAAVVAVFHDTIITIGLFSIFNKEISLTVIAALLTLVGYSMNDTIVVFDRIRENLRLPHREKMWDLVNKSVNQTLSRTILTSGLTFLTVLALFLFGGEVLHGFSLALVIGIIIGTYSSIFVASPIVVYWQDLSDSRKRPPGGYRPVAAAPGPAPRRGPVKAQK